MTEQEERYKATNEMANDLFTARCFVDSHPDLSYKSDRYHRIADCLISKGYRRAEDVRKEAIREVVEWYEDHQVCAGCDQMNSEAREHFGMEVLE